MKVKICGITHPDDAVLASNLGADWIGILFSPSSKRYVERSVASEIVAAALESGTIPVGVFVNESLDEILSSFEQTKIQMVQLHGAKSRACLNQLPASMTKTVSVDVSATGQYSQPDLSHLTQSSFLLYDSTQAGSGKTFPWEAFKPIPNYSWFLAGGLNCSNVEKAIRTLAPTAVDVSTGVSRPGKLRKDPDLMKEFIRLAKQEYL